MEDGPSLETMEPATPRVVEASKQDKGHAQIHRLQMTELIVLDLPWSLQAAIRRKR